MYVFGFYQNHALFISSQHVIKLTQKGRYRLILLLSVRHNKNHLSLTVALAKDSTVWFFSACLPSEII
jgi:phage-related baseplate assembly protein